MESDNLKAASERVLSTGLEADIKYSPNTTNELRFYMLNMNQRITTTSDQPLHAVANVICDANQKSERIEFLIELGPMARQDGVTVVIIKP